MFALVTGASGLLGRQLTEELVRRGHRVRALDVKPFDKPIEGVEFFKSDIRNSDLVQLACEGVEVVFHLAALLPQTRESEETFNAVNLRGTENVLEASVTESIKRFILSSSIEIYGIPDRVPCAEDAPKRLLGTYSRNKVECEELCRRSAASFGLEVVIMRMPMIFGPGYWHEMFYINMFEALGKDKPIRIIGDGSNRHQVVASSDVVNAYILAAEAPRAIGEAFNIASDPANVLSVQQTAQRVIERVGSRSKIKHVRKGAARALIKTMSAIGKPLMLDEHSEVPFANYVFEIAKAKELLGYKPRKTDVDAIVETVHWYWNSKGITR